MSAWNQATLVILAVVAVVVYMLPAIAASLRGHHKVGSIFVVNLLLGWTIIGWVAALAWSMSKTHKWRRRRY